MKVIGTGAPEVLTVRFERVELDGVRCVLRLLRDSFIEDAAQDVTTA